MNTNSILVGALVVMGLLTTNDAAQAAQSTAEAKSVAVRSESPTPSDPASTIRKVGAEQPKSDAGTETRDNGQASRSFETHAAKRVTIYNVGV